MIVDFLIKLGLVKIPKDKLFKDITKAFKKVVNSLHEGKEISNDKREKSEFEIILFFHCVSIPEFQKRLSDDTFDELRYYIQNRLLIQRLEGFKKEYIDQIMKERFDLHNKGLYPDNASTVSIMHYSKRLYDLFYEYPLEPIDEIKEKDKLELEFELRAKKQREAMDIIQNLVPTFRKTAKQLAMMTKE